jgi:hypothetical protein
MISRLISVSIKTAISITQLETNILSIDYQHIKSKLIDKTIIIFLRRKTPSLKLT